MAKFKNLTKIHDKLELVRSRVVNEKNKNVRPVPIIDREKESLLLQGMDELIESIQNQNWLDVVFNFGKFVLKLVAIIRKIRAILTA